MHYSQTGGYLPLYIGHPETKNKLLRYFLTACDYIKIIKKVKRDDTVFMQFPAGACGDRLLYKMIMLLSVKDLYILVHDIEALRSDRPQSTTERNLFVKATKLILHSEQMKSYVTGNGVDGGEVRILQCFDYLTNDDINNEKTNSTTVISVATTERSPFLTKISDAELGIHINLYGKRCEGYEKNLGKDITYKGTFKSDNVSTLEGSWGLVWDGDSVDTCSTPVGEYMRYNSPHKISLFVSAHIPIIIWDQAAKAEYVREKGLGICVSSLREIREQIDRVSDKEYNTFIKNLEKEAKLVRNGEMLRRCMEE